MIIRERIKINNKYHSKDTEINNIIEFETWILNQKIINNLKAIIPSIQLKLNDYLLNVSSITITNLIKNITKLYAFKYHFTTDYWMERGYSIEESKINAESRAGTTRLNNLIIRHGEIKGKKIYNNLALLNSKSHTLLGMIDRYGKKEGTEKYQNFINSSAETIKKTRASGKMKSDATSTLPELQLKYGIDIGLKRYNELRQINRYRHTEQFYVDKYGIDTGKQKYVERLKKVHLSAIGKASRESLIYFIPLYKELRTNGIPRDDIYFGVNGSYEYFILDTNNKIYFYDFTIKSKKIIIEYHGESFHPNPTWINNDKDKWENWVQPYSKQSANEVHIRDTYKKTLALNNGFTYFEIYSSDDYNETLKKIVYETKNICNK